MSDCYQSAPRLSDRRKVLALIEAIRKFRSLPEAEYLSRMSEVALDNGNPQMALKFADEAVAARSRR